MRNTSEQGKGFLAHVLLLPALLLMFALAGCGGGGGGGPVLVVSPATATLAAGASLPFSVTLGGVADTTVIWSASAGTITDTGLFTAPASPPAGGTVTVTAASKANPGLTGAAIVTITAFGNYSGVFRNISSMKVARANHTATLLSSGQVLIVGGKGSIGASIANVESFSMTTGKFRDAGTLRSPRAFHTATKLYDGRVLIVGGFDATNTCLSTAELYDPATGAISAAGSMGTARSYHTATLLPSGKVLIAGGSDSSILISGTPLASTEIYDPLTGKFTAGPAMKKNRYYHTAVPVRIGDVTEVLFSGGIGLAGERVAQSELYNWTKPTFGAFSTTGNMVVARWAHNATPLPDGKVMITGGNQGTIDGPSNFLSGFEFYFLTAGTGSYTAGADMKYTRTYHAATMLANGTTLVTGGFGDVAANPTSAVTLGSSEIFRPTFGTFTTHAIMQAARANHAVTLLPNGRVLITGGNQGGTFLKSAELYR